MRRLLLLAGLLAGTAAEASIVWAEWDTVPINEFGFVPATGRIGSINITLGRTIFDPSNGFVYGQCNSCVPDGNDYWRYGSGVPFEAYDAMPNLPANNHLVAPDGGRMIFTSSEPISELFILVTRLGSPFPQAWSFDLGDDGSFEVVDSGVGFFGDGDFSLSPGGGEPSTGIIGRNFHGVLRIVWQPSTVPVIRNFTFGNPLEVSGNAWFGLTFGVPRAGPGDPPPPPPPGVIPEPATWAMLIAGFGLVGAALRRRQRASAAA